MDEGLKQQLNRVCTKVSFINNFIDSLLYASLQYQQIYCNTTLKLDEIVIDKIEYSANIDYKTFRTIVNEGAFDCIYCGQKTIFTYHKNFADNNNCYGKAIIFLSKTDFTQLLLILFKAFIKSFCQNTRKDKKTVKTFNFKKLKIAFFVSIVAAFALLSFNITRSYFLAIVIFYYSICILLKSLFLIIGSLFRSDFKKSIINKEFLSNYRNNRILLPKYTILIPMFKENKQTLEQALNAIKKIEYPKDLLDVKLVLEEDDCQTRDVLRNITLPDYVIPIWTPYFEPRTKPKACNVASLFAEGEYLVIFDAEDIPNEGQLLKAVETFKTNKNCEVLQGCLSFYNYHQNFLTECFNIEYTVWFKMALQFYASYGIVIPLGGTSNHIKYTFLEQQNFWDSYNVTEDLELSVASLTNHIKTPMKHLNSDTKEWCVVSVKAFLKQRTRWLKGYLLTYVVHFFNHRSTFRQKLFFHLIIGYSALSFLFTPILLVGIIFIEQKIFLITLGVCNFVYYATYIFLYISLLKNYDILLTKRRIIVFLLYPFYFILHSISAYMAIYDIFKNPFYWSKTQHIT